MIFMVVIKHHPRDGWLVWVSDGKRISDDK